MNYVLDGKTYPTKAQAIEARREIIRQWRYQGGTAVPKVPVLCNTKGGPLLQDENNTFYQLRSYGNITLVVKNLRILPEWYINPPEYFEGGGERLLRGLTEGVYLTVEDCDKTAREPEIAAARLNFVQEQDGFVGADGQWVRIYVRLWPIYHYSNSLNFFLRGDIELRKSKRSYHFAVEHKYNTGPICAAIWKLGALVTETN